MSYFCQSWWKPRIKFSQSPKFHTQRSAKLDSVLTILSSTEQPARVSVTSFHSRHFVHMTSDKPFNCPLGNGCSKAVLFLAKHVPNSEDESSEDREVDNSLEKYTFCWHCEGYKVSCTFFSFCQFRVERNYVTSTRPGCHVQFKMTATEVPSFETNFVRITGTLSAGNSVSDKAECLLATGKDKTLARK